MIQCKRVYDEASLEDGTRVLVDRLWPRGVSKEEASLNDRMKKIAPSDALRRWFDPHYTTKISSLQTPVFAAKIPAWHVMPHSDAASFRLKQCHSSKRSRVKPGMTKGSGIFAAECEGPSDFCRVPWVRPRPREMGGVPSTLRPGTERKGGPRTRASFQSGIRAAHPRLRSQRPRA